MTAAYVPTIDWDDHSARAALIERIGPDAYNTAQAEHIRLCVLQTVNGHAIRPVSTRFGRLFAVGMGGTAFSTMKEASAFAADLPAGTGE